MMPSWPSSVASAEIPDALNAVEAELRLLAQRWQPRLQLWHQRPAEPTG